MWIDRLVALRHDRGRRWGAVLLAIVIAFAVRLAMPINLVFATFYPAVIFSALVAGRAGAFVCTLITAVLGLYFFMKPVYSFELESFSNALDLVFYIGISTICAELAEATARAVERAQDVAARNAYLVREMVHRQNNQLAVISAMLRLGARHADNVQDLTDQMSQRLQALATASAMDGEEREMIALIRQQLVHLGREQQMRTIGPSLVLSEKEALYIGMALHELATNSLKHGAWSSDAGQVTINWARKQDRVEISWIETCDPPPASVTRRRGFGTEVLERIVPAALNGEAKIELPAEGLVWTCRFRYEGLVETDQRLAQRPTFPSASGAASTTAPESATSARQL
jgi:two-component sensor histidine kinase